MADIEPLLPWIQPGWVGVEIGVSQGHSSKALLDHGVRFLYLVDPWDDYDGLLDKVTPGAWEECYRTVISQYPSRHAVLRMPSADAARFIPAGLDFVWIDGNHRYEWVKSDIDLYWPKIKSGGVLCGHDYCNAPPTCHVKQAVDEFVRNRHMHLELALPCWAVTK